MMFFAITACRNDASDDLFESDDYITIPLSFSLQDSMTNSRAHNSWTYQFDENGSFTEGSLTEISFAKDNVRLGCAVSYKNKWSILLNCNYSWNIKPEEDFFHSSSGITVYKPAYSERIYISFKVPKDASPKDIKIVVSSNIHPDGIPNEPYELNIYSNKIMFADDLRFNFEGSDSADSYFYAFLDFSKYENWEEAVSTPIVMKRFGTRITYLSDQEEYYSNFGYITSTPVADSYSLYMSPSKNIIFGEHYTKFIYDIEGSNLFCVPVKNYNSQLINFYSTNPSKITVPSQDNKKYWPVGAYILPCSVSGDLASIVDSTDDLGNIEKTKEGIKINHILSVYKTGRVYKAALLPLPEKLFPNKKYVIRNKPGVKFFPDKYQSIDSLETRSSEIPVHVVSNADIVVEEYDI